MNIVLRPAKAEDFAALGISQPEFRVRAITGQHGCDVVGIGGLAKLPDGAYGAFFYGPAARSVARKSLHKAGIMLMRQARELGLRRVVALADTDIAPAERWLNRLGFENINGVWVWQTR